MQRRWGDVNPPFTKPPAHVDWGLFYQALRSVYEDREVAEICDEVERVLSQTTRVFPGERSSEVRLPGDRLVEVGYVTSVDPDWYVRCTVRRVRVVGAAVAA